MEKTYSEDWAERTFILFYRVNPRGSSKLMTMYHFSSTYIVQILRKDQDRWNAFKKLAIYIEKNWDRFLALYNDEEMSRGNHLTYDKWLEKKLKKLLWKGESALDMLLQWILF